MMYNLECNLFLPYQVGAIIIQSTILLLWPLLLVPNTSQEMVSRSLGGTQVCEVSSLWFLFFFILLHTSLIYLLVVFCEDSPHLKVKPMSKRGGSGCVQLGVECYGGG